MIEATPGGGKKTSLPARGEAGTSSQQNRGRVRAVAVNPPEPLDEEHLPPSRPVYGEDSLETERIQKRLKPVKVVSAAKPPDSALQVPKQRGSVPVQSTNLPQEESNSARAIREKERVLVAAGLVTQQKLARIGAGNDFVFRCPVCSGQNQCVIADCGGQFPCSSCGALLLLPLADTGERIRVVSLPKKKADAGELPALELPDERSSEGRSREARFQAIEELLPEGEEAGLEWGLEKKEMAPEKRKRAATWLWFALPLVFVSAIILVRQIFSSSGRSAGEASTPSENELVAPSGEINWNELSAARKYLLADRTLRGYLDAPDLAAKAAFTRRGAADATRMADYYKRKGSYEPETRVHGPVQDIILHEEKTVGGKVFQLAGVRFAESVQGVYALERTAFGYLVDWEYSEGYGEMSFTELIANPPSKPVLMRGHLSETSYFSDGFDETGYRAFNMADPLKELTVLVFAARNSPVEEALARAWYDAVLDTIGDPTSPGSGELDFVLRVRHEVGNDRKGFVIDEVLIRGWIVPDETK